MMNLVQKIAINNILNLNNKVNDLKNNEYKFNVMNYNINQKRDINNFNSINPKKETIDINDIPKLLGKENDFDNDNDNSNLKNDNKEINNIENKNKDNILDIIKYQNENKKLIEENISLKKN